MTVGNAKVAVVPDDGGIPAQQQTTFTPDPLLKDGLHLHTRETDESTIGTDANNPFSDPEVADYWTNVYEKAHYECRHVFDPKIQWTAEEEKKLVRKLDWRVCLWAVSTSHQTLYTVVMMSSC